MNIGLRVNQLSENTDHQLFALRVESHDDFYHFARYMFAVQRGYRWQQSTHHQIVCDALMRVYRGECKRLIINIPPRYSKTELAVVNFMAWTMGRNPDAEFIHASYSSRLAGNNSYACRNLVMHEEYARIFPDVTLRVDSKAKDEWRTTAGGCVYATGAGGTITGYGAGKVRDGFGGAIIIDDAHKADEASSDVMRQNVLDWFQNTVESRKNSPHTPIIVIMQRLHQSDLSGWLLDGGNGEKWEHVCLPVINEDGTALWPEKHGIEVLQQMQNSAPYVFSGQYMQQPSPTEGGIFKPDQIKIVDALPSGPIQWVRGWDLASTTNGDWTAGVKLGKLSDGRFIIGDVVRLRVGPDERDAAIVNTAASDGRAVKIGLPQDPGQAGKTQVLYLTRQLSGHRVISSPESGSKIVRSEPVAAQVNVGNMLMLRAPWNDSLKSELRMFPNGTFDDQADGLARAFMELIGKSIMKISEELLRRY